MHGTLIGAPASTMAPTTPDVDVWSKAGTLEPAKLACAAGRVRSARFRRRKLLLTQVFPATKALGTARLTFPGLSSSRRMVACWASLAMISEAIESSLPALRRAIA